MAELGKKELDALLDAASKCISKDKKALLKYGRHHEPCLQLDAQGRPQCKCGLASEYRRIAAMCEVLGVE